MIRLRRTANRHWKTAVAPEMNGLLVVALEERNRS